MTGIVTGAPPSPPRRAIIRRSTLAAIALGLTLLPGPAPAEDPRDSFLEAIETRRILSREESDWAVQRRILEAEKTRLATRLADLEEEVGNLTAANARLRDRLPAETDGPLPEARTRDILQATNDALSEARKRLQTHLPATPGQRPTPLPTRPLEALRSGLKAVNQLRVEQGFLAVPGGETREIRVLWVGLGVALFTSPDGAVAGVGYPGPDGTWVWRESAAVARAGLLPALQVIEGSVPPQVVNLPLPPIIGPQP